MREPVVAADGFTYERLAIEAWLQHQRAAGLPPTSPMTNLVLEHTHLLPNRALLDFIRSDLVTDN